MNKEKKKEAFVSKAVREIEIYLSQIKVTYVKEKRYSECRDKKPLPFDFHIVYNGREGLIEYDGEQHFQLVSKYHGKDRKKLDKQKRHDKIKTMFAFDKKIALLRISYKQKDSYKLWIDRFLKLLRTEIPFIFSDPALYNAQINFKNKSLYIGSCDKTSSTCIIL